MNIFQAIADAITCHDVAYVREQPTEYNDNFVIAVNGVDTPGVKPDSFEYQSAWNNYFEHGYKNGYEEITVENSMNDLVE